MGIIAMMKDMKTEFSSSEGYAALLISVGVVLTTMLHIC